MGDVGIRAKVAWVAAIATVCILSLVGTLGFRALVETTRNSQIELVNQRLDELELQLEAIDAPVLGSAQVGTSLRVVKEGSPLPPPIGQTLRVIRPHPDPEIGALVGIVDTARMDATLATIRTALWLSVATLGLLVGATAWFVVDRALAPVRQLTRQAVANIESETLESVQVSAARDDISDLADTFNTMLHKLRGADMQRRRFVSDASHELRTPLMVLGAEAEYALDHPPVTQAGTVPLATSVLAQTERLTGLVDDLLSLATLDEAQTSVLEPASVSDLLAASGAEQFAEPLIAELGGTLVADVSRALGNVVSNASRHCRDRVDVQVERVGNTVEFTVDDDGPGIPQAEREHIFERFYRPDEDRGREGGGAGLGLAIAKAEALQAGGSIKANNNPNGGARIVLQVPVIQTAIDRCRAG